MRFIVLAYIFKMSIVVGQVRTERISRIPNFNCSFCRFCKEIVDTCTYCTTVKMGPRVWVKAINSDETVFKVPFKEGMDIDDLTREIILARQERKFKIVHVSKIFRESETWTEIDPGEQVLSPTDERNIGSSSKNPYFFGLGLPDIGEFVALEHNIQSTLLFFLSYKVK
jgi:hypothetical protein